MTMTTNTNPQVGQKVIAETAQGGKVNIEITYAEEERAGGWVVWGYRIGRSAFKSTRTGYVQKPNRYWLPKLEAPAKPHTQNGEWCECVHCADPLSR